MLSLLCEIGTLCWVDNRDADLYGNELGLVVVYLPEQDIWHPRQV